MNSEYVHFEGGDKDLDQFLGQYFSEESTSLVHHNMSLLKDSLDQSETFQISKSLPDLSENERGFMFFRNNYYINLRMTTLALIGLILDLKYTKGFTTFVMSTLGIKAGEIKKLKQDEKQFLLLVNAGKVIKDQESGEYSVDDTNNHEISSEKIQEMADKLIEDKIVYDKDGKLKVFF